MKTNRLLALGLFSLLTLGSCTKSDDAAQDPLNQNNQNNNQWSLNIGYEMNLKYEKV